MIHAAHGLLTLVGTDPAALLGRPATLSGALREAPIQERPLVGDWVTVDDEGRAQRVLPRRSLLLRRDPDVGLQPLAANVDVVFITTSLNLDLNPRRVERFVAVVRASGAEPVVVLTKADLVEDAAVGVELVRQVTSGAPVVVTSAKSGDVTALAPWLGAGRTLAFVGASGVGKSTIVNALLGRDAEVVSPSREGDDRGRHTTTDRRLHRAPDGTLLVDMPGIREVGLVGDEELATDVFPEIRELAGRCRWRDCAHGEETGCAVRAALADGSLSEARWLASKKLEQELAWARRQGDPFAQRIARDGWRSRTNAATARARLRDKNRW